MFQFIAAYLRRKRIGAAILIVLIALATGLGVAATLQERSLLRLRGCHFRWCGGGQVAATRRILARRFGV